MSITERSRRRVRRTRSRLHEEYGSFETIEDAWDLSAERYRGIHDRFEAGTIGGAGA
jgi:hypothetical protein